jgi:hypothetical protein
MASKRLQPKKVLTLAPLYSYELAITRGVVSMVEFDTADWRLPSADSARQIKFGGRFYQPNGLKGYDSLPSGLKKTQSYYGC